MKIKNKLKFFESIVLYCLFSHKNMLDLSHKCHTFYFNNILLNTDFIQMI